MAHSRTSDWIINIYSVIVLDCTDLPFFTVLFPVEDQGWGPPSPSDSPPELFHSRPELQGNGLSVAIIPTILHIPFSIHLFIYFYIDIEELVIIKPHISSPV